MTIPDSLETLGEDVFWDCSKLLPLYFNEKCVYDEDTAVVVYLRMQQIIQLRTAEMEKVIAEQAAENAALTAENEALKIAALTTEAAAMKIANVPAVHTDDFISTIDFKRHFVGFVHVEMLLVLREVCKRWNDVVVERIDESVESGVMIVHGGKGISGEVASARRERRALATQVIFLLNITKVGDGACEAAKNLVVVDIPDVVTSIRSHAFAYCANLTTVSFPTTLTSIGVCTFSFCPSLENVDLLHTNLQELGRFAFDNCSELKSMTIPDSLQTIGPHIFYGCSKLVPSNIIVSDLTIDTTPEVVTHLRSQMSLNALFSGNNFLNTDDFRRLIVPYLSNDALMAMRLASKPWSRVADEFISDGVESGTMMVHDGNDVGDARDKGREFWDSLEARHTPVRRVIFLLNIKKVGQNACRYAVNLVVVDIPEGVTSIGNSAFYLCSSLTTVSFPTTLTLIGDFAFDDCSSLENVYLLHTNLRKLGSGAFFGCSELSSMTIPDSLQTFGSDVFVYCDKLVPSSIDIIHLPDKTSEVVVYLRSSQI
ncbi:hypothetical protein TrLO_g7216 [Triparma laevis f. longispina]|uniref:Leucine-rich repeat protein n=1 Tax=Triparma laevis f. longispina TaxID=1714387 RepID=A0A9W6ZGK7_9STRA|nr:hypothetical protein TrLO_g7216 [Triparma laevis f. longispina]